MVAFSAMQVLSRYKACQQLHGVYGCVTQQLLRNLSAHRLLRLGFVIDNLSSLEKPWPAWLPILRMRMLAFAVHTGE